MRLPDEAFLEHSSKRLGAKKQPHEKSCIIILEGTSAVPAPGGIFDSDIVPLHEDRAGALPGRMITHDFCLVIHLCVPGLRQESFRTGQYLFLRSGRRKPSAAWC